MQFPPDLDFDQQLPIAEPYQAMATPLFEQIFQDAPEQSDNNFLFDPNEEQRTLSLIQTPSARTSKPRSKPPTKTNPGNKKLQPRTSIIVASKSNKQTIFSDDMTDGSLLDPTTQAQITASIPSTTEIERPVRLTIISADELAALRSNNRILRSNNISIMKQKGEVEEKLAAAAEELKKAVMGK